MENQEGRVHRGLGRYKMTRKIWEGPGRVQEGLGGFRKDWEGSGRIERDQEDLG